MKKKITITDIKELKKSLIDKREAWRRFRLGTAGSRMTNVKEGRELKRGIARLMTLINQHDQTV